MQKIELMMVNFANLDFSSIAQHSSSSTAALLKRSHNCICDCALHGFLTRLLFSVVLLWEVRWTWWLLVAVFRRRAAAPYVYRGNHRTAFNHMRVYIMLLSDNMGIQYQLELVDLHTIQRIGSMWRPNNSTNGPPNQLFFLLFDKSRRRTNDI